jgi:hypothetical protein
MVAAPIRERNAGKERNKVPEAGASEGPAQLIPGRAAAGQRKAMADGMTGR